MFRSSYEGHKHEKILAYNITFPNSKLKYDMMMNEIKLLKILMSEFNVKIENYRKAVLPKNVNKICSEIELKLSFTQNSLKKMRKKIKKIKMNLYNKTQNSGNKFL